MILIIDCGSKKTKHIGAMVRAGFADFKVLKMQDLNSDFSFSSFDKIIISGAPILLKNDKPDEYLEKFKNIFELNVPILGICFGHQIMGLHHGSTIKKCVPARGDQKVKILKKDLIFKGLGRVEVFNQDHIECISIPEEFEHLANSVICENEAMKHSEKPWYGLQFHPETSGMIGKVIFRNFINLVK